MQGKVKFFNNSKGFGFILENGTGKELFVHSSGLIDKITQDDKVDFEIGEGKTGPMAVKVRVIH